MVMTFALAIQGYQDGQPDALRRFAQSEEGDVKRLQGVDPPLYRLRAQDHRVIFRDLGDSLEITRVRHRSDAYR
jgi:mRNA-degrading endonuclease RelE of RelBE toxin-antitoxin system